MSDDSARAESALIGAVAFLLSARSPADVSDGCEAMQTGRFWRDFTAFGMESDEWVSAYTACALAESGDPGAEEAAHQTWTWLVTQSLQHGPGLGYSARTPQDADATVWGCRLAAVIGRSSDDWAGRAFRYLGAFACPDGGIATFSAAGLNALNPAVGADGMAGWTTSHACVTAVAAWLPGIAEQCDVYGFLARTQEPQGFWNAYWWADLEYATAHAVESLARGGSGREAIDRGLTWLGESAPGRSPFALALRVLGIATAGCHDFAPALRELLALQLADGSWPASARLRIPPPNLKDPRIQWNWDEEGDGIGSILLDRRRIFTTATALRALSSCLMR